MSINTVALMGRLTKDPNKTRAGETNVCHFTVAVDDGYRKDRTHFIDCDAWAGTAEFLEKYFHKGQMIALTGSLEQSSWTDKDGNKKSKTIVRADRVSFCSSKAEEDSRKPQFDQKADERRTEEEDFRPITDDDDLPF